jgi:Hemocyanin, ig-like domain
VDLLNTWQGALDAAVTDRELLREVGSPRTLDSNSLGEATEGAPSQLTGLRRQSYPGMHNAGHRMLARLPDGQGRGATCLPWWYAMPSAAPCAVASPDVLLVSTAELPSGADPAALATAAVGSAAFDTEFAAGPLPGAEKLVVVDELTTRFLRSTLSDGQTVTHLTHDPFALIIRVRNIAARPTAISLRVFIAPAQLADDRTNWMELDKMLVEVPAAGRGIIYRPDTEFSVVKKPAETDPQTVLDGAADPNDPNYCDCGWPYTLLLPRGTPEGMAVRLAVVCTDAARDLVRPSAECGSMSFCGAVERYPDTRDMGYPFSRPFARPIADTLLGVPSAAGRSLTIRHEP